VVASTVGSTGVVGFTVMVLFDGTGGVLSCGDDVAVSGNVGVGPVASGAPQAVAATSSARSPAAFGGESTWCTIGAFGRKLNPRSGYRRPASMTRLRNCRVRSWTGSPSTCSGGPDSRSLPPSRKQTRSATCLAKPISCVAITIVRP